MTMRQLGLAAALPLVAMFAFPALAGGWSIEKNEPDPFDKAKSTFVATTFAGAGALVIRCLQGDISLLVGSGPSNAAAGDSVELKLVADSKDVLDLDGEVLTATNFTTGVQFGDESTLEYLSGSQKISVRYTLAGATSTASFSGGRSLNDVIAKARKACGLQASETQKSPSQVSTGSQSSSGANTPSSKGTGKPESCQAQFERLKSTGDLGSDPDQAGFTKWCESQAESKP
jgi:hypothetical protein